MNPCVRLRQRATVFHVCLHKDVVQCVINRLLSCPCDVFSVSGALRWVAAKKVTTPPSPKGQQPASRHTRHLLPTSRAPMQKGVPDYQSYPFRIPWIASAVGCQSTHARLRSSSRGGQPALAPTSAPGARDHCRATGPRVYKSSWNPRPLQGNRPPCLQKFLDLEPSRATGPRVYNRSFHLNQRVKPTKTNETFNTGRTSDHVTSKLEKKPQHKGCR